MLTVLTVLTLTRISAQVVSLHAQDGSLVGNLKLIGSAWKFKALGFDAAGNLVPGGGPLTDKHNTVFSEPDAAQVNALLL